MAFVVHGDEICAACLISATKRLLDSWLVLTWEESSFTQAKEKSAGHEPGIALRHTHADSDDTCYNSAIVSL